MSNVTFTVNHSCHFLSHDRWFYEVCDLLPLKSGRSLPGIYKGNGKYFVIPKIILFIAQIELLTHESKHNLP